MYSSLLSDKPYAYGVETQDYWSFLGYTLSDRDFGYLNIPQMLGGAANVRYIVAQVQSEPSEVALFSSLDGLVKMQVFDRGAAIFENQMWEPQVHALDNVCLISGGVGLFFQH